MLDVYIISDERVLTSTVHITPAPFRYIPESVKTRADSVLTRSIGYTRGIIIIQGVARHTAAEVAGDGVGTVLIAASIVGLTLINI